MSGTITTAVTLSPSTLTVSPPEPIVAYGMFAAYLVPLGANGSLVSDTLNGAVFGPDTGHFTITNATLIEADGTSATNPLDAGILLGAAGTVLNSGTIEGGSGLALFGTTGTPGYVKNNQNALINGSLGVGIAFFDAPGTVVNAGSINGAYFGAVFLAAGGSISNASTGIMTGGSSGKNNVISSNGTGNIENAGTLIGVGGGIGLQAGGYVSNSGYIKVTGTGNTNSSYAGIGLGYGGRVFNSGTIIAQNGINLQLYTYSTNVSTITVSGYVDNTGLIEASSTNALFSTFGNQLGIGIELDLPGTVVNDGSITASNAGIFVQNTGTAVAYVQNRSHGTITSSGYGVFFEQSEGSLDNAGLIMGGTLPASAGVELQNGGTVTNEAGGTIIGYIGVLANNTAANVSNFGYIASAGGTAGGYGAIILGAGGDVTNDGTLYTQPTVAGGASPFDGIAIFGTALATNASTGRITGGSGVYFRGTGSFDNLGTIAVAGQGFGASGGARVTNSGLIQATASSFIYRAQTYIGEGVELGGGGAITNLAGTIAGGAAGIMAYGTTSVFNSGIVDASGSSLVSAESTFAGTFTLTPVGIELRDGGTVQNTGDVAGQNGIFLGDTALGGGTSSVSGYAENTGTVAAYSTINVTGNFSSGFDQSGVGVYLAAAGTVVNHGTIQGNHAGIVIENAYGTVDNTGLITVASGATVAGATPGYGIYLHDGGSVNNTGTIIGDSQGIFAGYTFNIVNSGAIDAPALPFVAAGSSYTGSSSGIFALGSGSINNTASAVVTAADGVGIELYAETFNFMTDQSEAAAGTLFNEGTVVAEDGLAFEGIGSVNNSGTVLARATAVDFYNNFTGAAAGILVNSGALEASGSLVVNIEGATIAGTGVSLIGGTIFNLAGGTISADIAVHSSDSVAANSYVSAQSFANPFYLSNVGLISGSQFGVYASNASEILVNSSFITATDTALVTLNGVTFAGIGVDFLNGGTVNNQAGGTIAGYEAGVVVLGSAGVSIAISNSGLIEGLAATFFGGTTLASSGVDIFGSGTLTNQASGKISALTAVYLNAGTLAGGAYFDNLGTVTAHSGGGGVFLSAGAGMSNAGAISGGAIGVELASLNNILINHAAGVITGTEFGVLETNTLSSGAVIENDGAITATDTIFTIGGLTIDGAAAEILDGGTLDNESAGVLTGYIGAVFTGDGTLINAGTIDGGGSGLAAYFSGTGNEVIVDPDAVFNGAVYNSAGSGTLELAAGFGSLGGVGPQIIGFSTIAFDSGATWVVSGNSAGLASGELFTGFAAGDVIDLAGTTLAAQSLTIGGGGVLTLPEGSASLDLYFSGDTGDVVTITTDGSTGIEIKLETAPCFCAGTRIATPSGDVAVEALRVGDKVKTALGQDQTIKWIGERAYEGRFIAGNHLILPVCLKAHALAAGVPARDLWVSPGHAIYVGGALVPAWRLINGVTITQAERVDRVHYFHVELAAHDVILAENCPAESFYDDGCRGQFHNAAPFDAAGPESPPLPRLEHGFGLQTLQARFHGTAQPMAPGRLRGFIDQTGPVISGWAQDTASPETPVCLDIFGSGRRIARVLANHYRADLRAAGIGSGCHGFALRLSQAVDGEIRVRRASDGADLVLTANARERAA